MIADPSMLWLVIASGVACFFMAFVTGANDIANTFSTSIGAKSLTIKKALLIAFFFEALGASLLGGTVTDSIRSKIINFEAFYNAPEFLMLGMFSALVGASLWLAIATCLGLPVSTTHSIVGALLGFGLSAGHADSIKWAKIQSIVISWFAAPLLAGSCSAIAFSTMRSLILRKKNSFEIIKKWYWILIFLITLPFSVFLVYQNPIVLNTKCRMKQGNKIVYASPCYLQDWSSGHVIYATLISITLSLLLTGIGSIFIYIVYNKRLKCYNFRKRLFEDQYMNDIEQNVKPNTTCNGNNSSLNSVASNETQIPRLRDQTNKGNNDNNEQIEVSKGELNNKSGTKNDIEQNVIETFDQDTEIVFATLQIISAILGVIAQSANDTANAIGPFAAVFNTYNSGIREKIKVQWYILLFGGLSMSLGLSILGYRVIKTVGMKLIKITPSRGFTIELISGLVVLFFSICGIPLSSTHCAVSSVIGLGLVEARIFENDKNGNTDKDVSNGQSNANNVAVKKRSLCPFSYLNTSCVNLKLFRTIFLSWIITVSFSASVTAAIFSFAAYTPSYVIMRNP
ncbi:solute carrier 20, member 1 [Plasmodium yoelii]|uniref:Phosphate transporter n=3 Tax=Plasmodium yoelii TaxID=5861 RepID=A0AAF0B6Y1_PLAYO|nr:solute carrier 20, member 1 [Plasmodium yoelii]EAA20710.1 solute carrier family 20, member 1-related [Plasmodium yoelii yoelii]WBY60331.1 sodium-dependent phosphate transporter [Plasmodium yoelii yoelii]CDU20210.1 sodium-dependent phosphate transporter, putative [Plasmodium yoelii]VTZ80968.1 sodium-dependent phosphate transporter, putative [Plasmodium yoelii]|eukprot:XP_729145.1 solute carrier 20, member 1 [Plasmodium yoelii]